MRNAHITLQPHIEVVLAKLAHPLQTLQRSSLSIHDLPMHTRLRPFSDYVIINFSDAFLTSSVLVFLFSGVKDRLVEL
jgi:hypothetical protein